MNSLLNVLTMSSACQSTVPFICLANSNCLKRGANLGYFKKRGGAQLQAASGGALEENIFKLIR